MSRVALIGPGAIGCVIGAYLQSTARHSLTLCARRALDVRYVELMGRVLELESRVCTDPTQPDACDWILVATKAYDSKAAAAWFPRLRTEGRTPVAVLQNGVEHRERFSGVLAAEEILPVMVDCPAERGPAGVRQRGPARLLVEDSAYGQAFVQLFAGAASGITVATTPDFKTEVWRKLCLNAVGVISALVDQPAGVMRESEAQALGRAILREAIAVGRAAGARLPDEVEDQVIDACRTAPIDAVNSLHADVRARRQSEIDARNGAVVRFGRKHGIATPCNAMAVELVTLMTRK